MQMSRSLRTPGKNTSSETNRTRAGGVREMRTPGKYTSSETEAHQRKNKTRMRTPGKYTSSETTHSPTAPKPTMRTPGKYTSSETLSGAGGSQRRCAHQENTRRLKQIACKFSHTKRLGQKSYEEIKNLGYRNSPISVFWYRKIK
jgi:hypothetical protein